MRRATLTVLASVALVAAAGAFGAAAVDDAADSSGGANATSPFTGGEGAILGPDAVESSDSASDDGWREEGVFVIGGSRDAGETSASDSEAASSANASGVEGDDSDGDGLANADETDRGTNPVYSDTDGDGLADDRELEAGTDPTEADTDGDRLLDSWELAGRTPSGAALPGADPLSKDIYLQVDYGRGTERRDEAFYAAIASEFAEMPVDNPDNSSGIAVHVRDGGPVNESVRFTGENFWALKDRYYESELGPRAGVYHQVLVAHFADEQAGYGEVGGEFVVVESGLENETQQHAVVHELLHNVVGRVEAAGVCTEDPTHYCEGGYLGPRFVPGEEQSLSEGLARQLEVQGFAG